MLQAVAPPAFSYRRVLALVPGPLGPRFRVHGLLGHRGLAAWIERAMSAIGPVRASASSGIVRVDARLTVDRVDWATELERCVATFDAVSFPPRDGRARQRRGTTQRTPLAPRAASATSGAARATGAPVAASQPFHAWTTRELQQRCAATSSGLSKAEAAARLARDGVNELRDITARSDAEILLSQFKSVPVALLAGSGTMALVTRAFADAAAIGAVLAANGAIGYVTERQAERTVSALRKLAPQSVPVLRDGREVQIPARDVVIGDVLVLKPGQPVPADARVIASHRLSTNEAPLTGESLPVRKEVVEKLPQETPIGERRNLLHMGTVISGGTGRAVVVATAERTVLGRIRALAQTAEAPRTRLQTELDGLGKRLALGASALCLGVFGIGLARGRPTLPMLRTAVALGVAAIPEGLPTVATSLLAAGIRTLQKRHVYARRMDAIENLGAVDVVGLDKTGTLTQNRMAVAAVSIGRRRTLVTVRGKRPSLPADFSLVAALCNDIERANGGTWQGSSTEIALIEFVAACGAPVDTLRRAHPRRGLKQRSEHHPYMVALHRAARGQYLVAVKGRPQEVLERCTHWFDGKAVVRLTAAERRRVLRENDGLAALGQRVLALALKRQKAAALGETGGLTLLGLIGLSDPLRPGIAESIGRFRAAGIRPVMLTGDQIGTAQAVANAIGLGGTEAVADAGALPEDARRLTEIVERASGFARSSPAMKLQIIRALQSRGHVVAMTGDGINDGPALKMADIGVAMGQSGTDFAQAMSGLVLKDDHPDGLLAAIAEGRTAYLNVKKAVQYLVATNVSELALMALSVAAGLPDPLGPLPLLWINLISDVSPAIALGLEPPEPDILQRPPFPRESAFLSAKDWRGVAVDGGMITAAAMASFLYGLARYGPTPRASTLAFMSLTSAQLLYALSARSETPLTVFGRGRLRKNPWLSRTVLLSLSAQATTVLFPPLRALLRTTPIGLADTALIAACAVAPTLGREGLKRLRRLSRGARANGASAR